MPNANVKDPPPFLPPRRLASLPNLIRRGNLWQDSTNNPSAARVPASAPFFPERRPYSNTLSGSTFEEGSLGSCQTKADPPDHRTSGRPESFQSFSSGDTATSSELGVQRTSSNDPDVHGKHRREGRQDLIVQLSKHEHIRNSEPTQSEPVAHSTRRPTGRPRQSSLLRYESPLSGDESGRNPQPPTALGSSYSDTQLIADRPRPNSHPPSHFDRREEVIKASLVRSSSLDLVHGKSVWKLPPLPPSQSSTRSSQRPLGPKPRPSFVSLSSLDNLLAYRQERAEWDKASEASSRSERIPPVSMVSRNHRQSKDIEDPCDSTPTENDVDDRHSKYSAAWPDDLSLEEAKRGPGASRSKFRHFAAEVGFCFTIAMTQLLAEYLISGFAIELPKLLSDKLNLDPGSMGLFWPASLLSLILSATLLIWARLSDMYGGYFIFMFGLAWLAIWTLVPGFYSTMIWLDISRAMQGLALAAFMPSTFSMVGSIYPEGPRRNFVMGLYSGCAPLGFFTGFLVAGALPNDKAQWYWFVASALSLITFITSFLSVPSDRTDRQRLGLKMDWIGSFLIMSGLILVSYAFAVEPYANQFETDKPGFAFPIVIGPFASGIMCLAVGFWYEGWCASCPLLPFDFFKPRSVRPFSLACLCFYASYGVWLYNSAQYFQSSSGNSGPSGNELSGITLALWYTPTAVGGIVLCLVGGSLMHIVPIMILLLFSALAWIAAPLLLALAPMPLHYWSYVVPSMLCATAGIDLTFTISIVFFSSVQPLRYQGLSGAVCSILVNLAMSFALSISEIVMEKAESIQDMADNPAVWGFRATFIYAAASAAAGLIICVMFVRISRSVVRERPPDEERPRPTSSDSTLIGREDEQVNEPNEQDSVVARQQEA